MLNTNRIHYIDVLRGFAVLGILIMNMPDFAFIDWQNENPALFEGINSVNYKAWQFYYIFLDGKMRGILSIFFGASIILITSKPETDFRLSNGKAYYRRMFWLLFICFFTCYIFMAFTTILYEYAICGMLLYWVRNFNPKLLIGVGLSFLIIFGAFTGQGFYEAKEIRKNYDVAVSHIAAGTKSKEDIKVIKDWNRRLKETIEGIKEAKEYSVTRIGLAHSGYTTIFPMAALMVTDEFISALPFGVLETLATVLLGMGLFKTRFLKGEMSNKFYLITAIVFLVGGTLIGFIRSEIVTVANNDFTGATLSDRYISVNQTEQIHRLLFIFGYMALFIFIVKKGFLTFITKRLQLVGKMAISNYLFQNIALTFIFLGYGLDQYGYLQRYQLYFVAFGLWAIQITFSSIWLKYYSMGPVEWLWRSLIYWRKLPLKIRTPAIS